jgi:hypothetical protein
MSAAVTILGVLLRPAVIRRRGIKGRKGIKGRSDSDAPLEPSATKSRSFARETWHVVAADLVVAKRFVPHLLPSSGAFHETPFWLPSCREVRRTFQLEKLAPNFAAPY